MFGSWQKKCAITETVQISICARQCNQSLYESSVHIKVFSFLIVSGRIMVNFADAQVIWAFKILKYMKGSLNTTRLLDAIYLHIYLFIPTTILIKENNENNGYGG